MPKKGAPSKESSKAGGRRFVNTVHCVPHKSRAFPLAGVMRQDCHEAKLSNETLPQVMSRTSRLR